MSRLRKQEEKERLKNMLTQLTQEMRTKYQIEQDMTAGPDDHALSNSDQQRPKKLCNPPLHNNYLKQQPQVKEEEVFFSSISQTPAQQQM